MERALQYRDAGADGIFPEGLDSEEAFQRIAEKVPAALLANMTEFGRTPYFSADQFAQWGYRMVWYPVSSLRVAAKAYSNLYRTLLTEGSQVSLLESMQTRQELYDLIDYRDYPARRKTPCFSDGDIRRRFVVPNLYLACCTENAFVL